MWTCCQSDKLSPAGGSGSTQGRWNRRKSGRMRQCKHWVVTRRGVLQKCGTLSALCSVSARSRTFENKVLVFLQNFWKTLLSNQSNSQECVKICVWLELIVIRTSCIVMHTSRAKVKTGSVQSLQKMLKFNSYAFKVRNVLELAYNSLKMLDCQCNRSCQLGISRFEYHLSNMYPCNIKENQQQFLIPSVYADSIS